MRKINTYILILFSMFFLLDTGPLSAQSRVNIIQADRAEGGIVDGQNVRKILGNVILTTDSMTMETDSVYQFADRNLLMAFNSQIETENDMIWADTLYHFTLTDFSQMRGRVIIRSDQNIMFSDSLDVDQKLDLATFNVPVRFEDEQGTLIAESGLYYQASDSAIFRGNVQLADSTQYLEADSLFMNRSEDLYELFGRVYADDFEENVRLAGEYLYADSAGYRLLERDAWLMEINESGTDTTHLFAEKIELLETDTTSFMDAYENVRIWSPRFSAIADTAHFRDDIEQFILRSNPALWQKTMQLTGPYIEAFLEEDEIKFLKSYPRPIIVQEDSVTGRLHQMTGDTLHAFFEGGEIERIRVFNNTEIIFHQRDEEDQPDGLIELMSAGPSTMYFLDADLDFFRAEQNIDGSYLPEDPANIGRQLDNFRWDPEQRPEKPEPREPRLPPIPDERPFELPPRYLIYLESLEPDE
jgi:lipopolysaccharide export system protein LptA